MYNNKIKKVAYISIILLILLILIFSNIGMVYAATQTELQNQQNAIDKQIEETCSEIAGVKSKMSNELTQINRLNIQISGFRTELDELEKELSTLNTQISEKETLIKQKEEEFTAQEEMLKKRLVALYEAGTVSYLDMLLSSKGLSDFISKYYLISELANCDNELLDTIEKAKLELGIQKAELDAQKSKAEQAKQTAERKKNTLDLTVSEKNAIVSNLSAEEKELQAQLEEFEADKRAIQLELAKIAAASGNITVVAPSAAGYISPIPGRTKRNITTGYYGYSGHTGVDFACPGGTPIVAVKSGVVVTSTALKRANGSYRSYGEYIVINHYDGTMTLYAHMLPGSRMVHKGDTVVQGQQIGQVGTTGNSTGNHLHFEVRVNGSPVNPTPYLP